MMESRRSLLVFEPRGQRREERQARKRQRSAAQREDDVDYRGNSYSGMYNHLPSGPNAVPLIAKRTTTQTRTKGDLVHQASRQRRHFALHEVRRVVPNPGAPTLQVAQLHLEVSGVAELCLAAGGEGFSGSTQIVLLSGLPADTVASRQVQLSGRYPVNPSGCGKLTQSGSHFRIKLPKQAAAAAAVAIQAAVQQGRVTVRRVSAALVDDLYACMWGQDERLGYGVQCDGLEPDADQHRFVPTVCCNREDYVAEVSPVLHHIMLAAPPPAQQPQPDAAALAGPALLLPGPQQQEQQQQQQQQQQQEQQPQGADPLDPDGLFDQVLNGHFDPELLGHADAHAGAGAGEQHYSRLTVGGEQPAAGRGAFAACSFVVQGSAAVTGELWAQGQMVVSDARKKENIRAFDEAEKSLRIVTSLCSYLIEFKASLLAQHVSDVLKRHEAEGLNIVKADAQGSLAVDFAALQTLLMSALKQVHADTEELRRTQSAFQLMVLGRLETMAAAQQVAGAGGGLPASPSLGQFLGPDEDYDMATSDSGEGSEEGAGSEAGEQADEGELRGMSEVQAAHWLMARLCEQAGAQKMYLKLAGDLSLGALWETYQATLAAPAELTADGTAQRTLGGKFIKLAKQRIQAEKMRQKATAQGSGPVQLRGYQRRLVAAARSGGNFIFVAPTNSGKTAVALEHAAHVLGKDSSARVVFVAPTVALATQQAAAFCGHPSFGPRGFGVGCFTSDNPIAPRDWRKTLQEYHVVVLTPQILVNALDAGEAHFSQIALLILGLTATPTSKDSLAATLAGMRELARNLAAEYVVVDEKDAELLLAVPSIEQAEIVVQLEAADDGFARRLGAFVVAAVERLQEGLGLPDLSGLPQQVVAMLRAGGWSATVIRWTRSIAERLQAAVLDGLLTGNSPVMHDATSALALVRAATAALALVSDVGFEAAVRHLSGEYFTAASKAVPSAGSTSEAAVGPITSALLAQLAEEVVEADVLEGTFGPCSSAEGRDSWHAIVFARTREAVRTLAALLQGLPELPGMQVHVLMGHGGGAAVGGGMTSKQQQAAMEAFRQQGRQLLVATAAGEEGIDVPCCELVVRFAATQTGRERLQSAGRARKHGSRFVEIIGATASELALVHKSRREEEHLRTALQGLAL
ncbi:hypothetical protein COHA_008096 [Chlorella ohadii]|uniref:RNA helicase n=1 Tax=Chlorella ohadii TaxID=2649997 RepID=A0AAD5H3I8_9CHLO|nr:hypothetical protein COHA_008096 [Chlorella ohadii]